MEEYKNLVRLVLEKGEHKSNRTGVDTISYFGAHYKIDLSEGFPLLTTKKMDDYRWQSLIHEFLWYISGEEHIKNLRKKTKIWDAWADQEGRLQTAYGRFWRRFPIPEKGMDGESWPEASHRWVRKEPDGSKSFDQIKYVIDTLKEHPESRRIVVSAWHPANAAISKLPPCHYTFAFNVQGNKLNLHMTQRSCDIALGVPFNIAAYSLLNIVIAHETELKVGEFSHTLIDAHIYCGKKGERGNFYKVNFDYFKEKLKEINKSEEYLDLKHFYEPALKYIPDEKIQDHIPGLLEQLSRKPYPKPILKVAKKPLEELVFEDFKLENYQSHPKINFGVAV